jgi:hypothetical protein
MTPDRIDAIRELEAHVDAECRRKIVERGMEIVDGQQMPTFFRIHSSQAVPIDAVVLWSRTARGGRQYELFAPEREEGCVRWGLCESMQKEDE